MSSNVIAEPVGVPLQTMIHPVQTVAAAVQMPLVQYSAPVVQQFQPTPPTYAAPSGGQTFQHQGLTLKVAGQESALPTGQVFQHQGLQLKVAGQPTSIPQPGHVFQHQGIQLQVAAPQPTSVQMPAHAQMMARPAGFPRGPQDLLAKGPLVINQEVSRDYLIDAGNLLIDERADAAVHAQLVALQPQALTMEQLAEIPSPHPNVVQHAGGTVASNDMQLVHHTGDLPDCEWMYGDAAMGALGIHALAHLNPLRWSGSLTLDEAIAQLTDVHNHGDRPISLKIPANHMHQDEFPNALAAIQHIEEVGSGQRRV